MVTRTPEYDPLRDISSRDIETAPKTRVRSKAVSLTNEQGLKNLSPNINQPSTASLKQHSVNIDDKELEALLEGSWVPMFDGSECTSYQKTAVNVALSKIDKENAEPVRLFRGCNKKQLLGMLKTGSAKGEKVANPETDSPTDKQARDQVGGEGVNEKAKLPEFTNELSKAQGFGTGGYVCLFQIHSQYLTKGSETELGWVCNNDAPVKLIGWKKGSEFIGSPKGKRSSEEERLEFIRKKNEELAQQRNSGTNLQSKKISVQETQSNTQPKKGSLKRPKTL